jgi:hypothetical protein
MRLVRHSRSRVRGVETNKNFVRCVLQTRVRLVQLASRFACQLAELVTVGHMRKCPKYQIRTHGSVSFFDHPPGRNFLAPPVRQGSRSTYASSIPFSPSYRRTTCARGYFSLQKVARCDTGHHSAGATSPAWGTSAVIPIPGGNQHSASSSTSEPFAQIGCRNLPTGAQKSRNAARSYGWLY